MGNVIRSHSKLSKLALEGTYFVAACLKLGSQFINHQCKSFNCKVEKFVDENDNVRLVVRAVRLIEVGEEVSYCYNVNMIDFRFSDGCKCSDCVEFVK